MRRAGWSNWAQIVNQTVYYGIWLTAFICIVQLAKDIRRLALQRT
jgi:hypothetical protein